MKKVYFINTYINTFINKIDLPTDKRKNLIDELNAASNSGEGDGLFYHLLFKSGSGRYISVTFLLRNQEDTVDFIWSMMNCCFTLSSTMIIRRKTKSSLFSDREWDDVSYVPSDIRKEDLENFFAVQSTILSNKCLPS